MTPVRYPLDEFVEDTRRVLSTSGGVAEVLGRGSSLLERFIRTPECPPEELRIPNGAGSNPNHGSYLLYRETPHGEGLTINAEVWGPGDHAAPHDHHTWGLIGVVQNSIQETRFRRLDDGRRPDYALLEQDWVSTFQPGQVSTLTPDLDEIHQMDNPSDRVTVEVHVYGRDLAGLDRCRFDPATGRITRWMTKRWDNE